MRRKDLMTYCCDKGCFVINGVCFDNGIGDVESHVIACDEQPEGVKELAWIDLRDTPTVNIWGYDCDPKSSKTFAAEDFYNADIISIGIMEKDSDGRVFIWKMA